jgi:putative ABC transport system permease protein
VQRGMAMSLVGVALGVAAALLLTRFMRSLLFGVESADPLTFVAIGALLAAITLLAISLPARRAARTDPAVCLRCE